MSLRRRRPVRRRGAAPRRGRRGKGWERPRAASRYPPWSASAASSSWASARRCCSHRSRSAQAFSSLRAFCATALCSRPRAPAAWRRRRRRYWPRHPARHDHPAHLALPEAASMPRPVPQGKDRPVPFADGGARCRPRRRRGLCRHPPHRPQPHRACPAHAVPPFRPSGRDYFLPAQRLRDFRQRAPKHRRAHRPLCLAQAAPDLSPDARRHGGLGSDCVGGRHLPPGFQLDRLLRHPFHAAGYRYRHPRTIADPFMGNDPLWSLSYEFWFYLLFPLVFRPWLRWPAATTPQSAPLPRPPTRSTSSSQITCCW